MPYYPPGYQAPSPYASSHLMQPDNGMPQLPPPHVSEPNTPSPGAAHPAKRKQVKNACSKCLFIYSPLAVSFSLCICVFYSLYYALSLLAHRLCLCIVHYVQLTHLPCGLPIATTMKKKKKTRGTNACALLQPGMKPLQTATSY